MPTEPPMNERPDAGPHHPGDSDASRVNPPLERSRFGGTTRRPERAEDDNAPVSRSDLSKGPQGTPGTSQRTHQLERAGRFFHRDSRLFRLGHLFAQ